MPRTAQDATAWKAAAEQPCPWPIRLFSPLQTTTLYAALPPTECPAPPCPLLRRAQVECLPTNRSMLLSEEFDPGRSPMRSTTRLHRLMQHSLPAIRNVAPIHIEPTARRVMERTDAEGARLARLSMVHTSHW